MYAYYNRKNDLPVCNRSWNQLKLSAAEKPTLGIHTLGSCTGTERKVSSVKMSTITVSDQETKQCIKLIDKSMNKSINMLDLADISKLVSCSSHIMCLPDKITQLTNELNELEVNNRELPEFSELMDLLKILNKLQVFNNKLESLPKRIAELQNLTTLNLSHNKLTELPDNLSALKNLETLDLSDNQLEDLPFSYANLQKLKKLDLSNNKFKVIPKCIRDGMVTLRILDISQNESIKMNIIPRSKNLEKFYAKDNGNCNKFPDWIVTPKFFNLKDVDLSRTKFDIYSFVGKDGYVNIKSFAMASSNLSNTVLEMMIENMICLEKMNVSNAEQFQSNALNIFNEIPVQALKNPITITEINFRETAISSVTPQINQLINLKKLDVGLNCILWLPEEICELVKLEYLIVDGNGLFMLPDNIGNMKSLKEIQASKNSLVRLPITFQNLDNLILVDLYDNKIEEFPNFLSEMTSLQSLDIELNFFSTDEIKIGEKLYFHLYNNYLAYQKETVYNSRQKGVKQCETVRSEESLNSCWTFEKYIDSDEEASVKSFKYNCDSDDNWDIKVDTDDEFDPEDPKIAYDNGKPKNYVHQKPQGFCPEDLHLKKIKSEVSAMRAYGSLPSYQIEPGQFDDAE